MSGIGIVGNVGSVSSGEERVIAVTGEGMR